ncbi:hypothetical protein Caci_8806 [Catenulispora acidiphila DSM 44928]|uniref:Cell wall-active antibiotics response LiaF-like C-terminal domain-containing protein n=1 Tax=Catenulispora acidiphila (strain DSM 44928 / JCM 14897 / NBRC 102108 / NRRL B-24433 / ID139908) TaxID=479433 RepID=C7Q282_CATAD|nr:hypothetical protein [Catenulispora acidiphila]ACU77619.1 hypothetical protein Caci_8806 [Catenulispora acidiphila DSM 44928]
MNSSISTTRTAADAAAEPVRLHVDHNAVKRLGNWTSADRFEVRARRGSVVLDLRSAQLPAGELVVDLDLDRALVKLLLPDDAVVDQRDIAWSGSGKVKDSVGQHNARKNKDAEPAADVRRVRLTGRIHSGEVRVARGGVAMLAAMFSREYVEDVKQARREGTWPTVDDPTRAPKNA